MYGSLPTKRIIVYCKQNFFARLAAGRDPNKILKNMTKSESEIDQKVKDEILLNSTLDITVEKKKKKSLLEELQQFEEHNQKIYSQDPNTETHSTSSKNAANSSGMNEEFDEIDILNNTIRDQSMRSNFLVKQPKKSFRWGEDEESNQKNSEKSKVFQKGVIPTYSDIVNFLELWRFKDIKVFPTVELGLNHLKNHSIICTGFNSKHIYKCGKELSQNLKETEVESLRQVQLKGEKHDEMMRVEFSEIEVFMFTEEGREDTDLENKWMTVNDKDSTDYNERIMKEKMKLKKYKF